MTKMASILAVLLLAVSSSSAANLLLDFQRVYEAYASKERAGQRMSSWPALAQKNGLDDEVTRTQSVRWQKAAVTASEELASAEERLIEDLKTTQALNKPGMAALVPPLARVMLSSEQRQFLTQAARQVPEVREALLCELDCHIAFELTKIGHRKGFDVGHPRIENLMAEMQTESAKGLSLPDPLTYDVSFRLLADAILLSTDVGQEQDNFLKYLLTLTKCFPKEGLLRQCIFDFVDGYVADPNKLKITDAGLGNLRVQSDQYKTLGVLWDRVYDLEVRVTQLEQFRQQTKMRLSRLEDSVVLLQQRVTALEEWRKTVEERLNAMLKRIEALETFARDGTLPPDEQNRLLDMFAPVFLFDSGGNSSGPVLNPSEFAEGAELTDRPNGKKALTAAEMAEWLKNEGNSKGSTWQKMSPVGWKNRPRSDNASMNAEAIRLHKGVFGHVKKLQGEHMFSVKYILFLAENVTNFPGGEGYHEGDWLCVDFQVHSKFRPGEDGKFDYELLYGVYHHHGKQTVTRDIQKTPDGRPLVYMERGVNEAHPDAGGDDYFDGVREHDGKGLPYDTRGGVRNLNTSEDIDCQLVRNYRGKWGNYVIDRFSWVPWIGQDIENPEGPPWQPKMWDRSFSKNPDDPISGR